MDKTILRFLTAGSVDDGKSSFLGRLLFDSNVVCEDHLQEVKKLSQDAKQDFTDLSLLIDGLESERSQKITIDAAYRYFTTKKENLLLQMHLDMKNILVIWQWQLLIVMWQ